MSELINNSLARKQKLKELLLKIHHGGSQESVRNELLHGLIYYFKLHNEHIKNIESVEIIADILN